VAGRGVARRGTHTQERKLEMEKVKLSILVMDFDLYPRNDISASQVNALCDAIEMGDPIPPILADKKSKRIVDGFHRFKAYTKLKKETVEVVWKTYHNEGELFADAVRLNSTHGRPFDPYDRQRCVQRLLGYKIKPEAISEIVRIPLARIDEITRGFASTTSGKEVVVKHGLIASIGNRRLTKEQVKVNESYSGMQPTFHVNQLIRLIESNLSPQTDTFSDAMDRLCELWKEAKVAVS